ncbi:MAG: hypothetical protein ABW189_09430 [Rickettsiales bacterium]
MRGLTPFFLLLRLVAGSFFFASDEYGPQKEHVLQIPSGLHSLSESCGVAQCLEQPIVKDCIEKIAICQFFVEEGQCIRNACAGESDKCIFSSYACLAEFGKTMAISFTYNLTDFPDRYSFMAEKRPEKTIKDFVPFPPYMRSSYKNNEGAIKLQMAIAAWKNDPNVFASYVYTVMIVDMQ